MNKYEVKWVYNPKTHNSIKTS